MSDLEHEGNTTPEQGFARWRAFAVAQCKRLENTLNWFTRAGVRQFGSAHGVIEQADYNLIAKRLQRLQSYASVRRSDG